MRKLGLVIVVFLFVSLIFCQKAEAHFLDTDGSIGAILHVDPNDEPIAGEQSSFFFAFKDTQNKFNPEKCDCIFSIVENGSVIYEQPLFANNSKPSLENASVVFTFPQKDVYQIRVVGKPQVSNAFQPFTLTWNFRVDQQVGGQVFQTPTENSSFTSHFTSFIGLGIIILFFVVYVVYKLLHKKSVTVKESKKK